jgi:GH24 family phage-related lysozyme (muramidase)
MAGSRKPGPLCATQDGFDTGTLARSQSTVPGPVCTLRAEEATAAAVAHKAHTNPKAKAKPHAHHKHGPLPKPDPKVMAAINNEVGTKIDFNKLADFEGGQQVHGYVPIMKDGTVAGQSGVTIATGFDIGQRSAASLKGFGFPPDLEKKYEPFCNKTKQDAVEALKKANGLTITKAEADETDMKIQRYHLVEAKKSWNGSIPKGGVKFEDLTSAQQTVLLSRTYHQGPGMPKTKIAQDFYTAAQKGDWVAAEKALRNYKVTAGWYITRVHQEADLLAKDLASQKAAAPASAGQKQPAASGAAKGAVR